MKPCTALAALTAGIGSAMTSDELQTLIVALFSLGVRELVYWWTHRKSKRPEVSP